MKRNPLCLTVFGPSSSRAQVAAPWVAFPSYSRAPPWPPPSAARNFGHKYVEAGADSAETRLGELAPHGAYNQERFWGEFSSASDTVIDMKSCI